MHKITKGLKKKKKGKKSKHKEDELFKPEELEAYRREHQAAATAAAATEESSSQPGQNEEWKKFIALTSGVDDILKKTQGDLDRIKSTSFFQRVPPPSELKQQNQQPETPQQESTEEVAEDKTKTDAPLGIVQISESESEEEEDDDIFDTAYIEALAAGDVKLAYIPESPTEDTGEDPFDTSYAERAILGPAVERKGKKLVPLGAAVEVLTGRAQIPTCATKRPTSSRRQILKERDLLLGSFDDNANSIPAADRVASPEEIPKTLLDDDAPIPLSDEPIDLSKSLHLEALRAQSPSVEQNKSESEDNKHKTNDVISEFDVITKVEDEDDEDFALLAAESLTKTPVNTVTTLPPVTITPIAAPEEGNWAAFAENGNNKDTVESPVLTEDVDPFDTAFAENILPGKAELKIIEEEILKEDLDFNPRVGDKLSEIINKVSIKVTDPAGQRESISSDRVSENELNLITPLKRDLLGGSNTDLSNLGDQPLKPSEQIDDNYIEYCDPFDTSIVETAKLPGHTELKFIEKELLGDIKQESKESFSDDDFDPRASESKERTLSRPDVLNISSKTVSFDLPTPPSDLLAAEDTVSKVCKPLTPFYVRKNSAPGLVDELDESLNEDPFDTSFVSDIGPGKIELKLIESELFDPAIERTLSISDQNFDPRDEKKVKIQEVVESIKDIACNKQKVEVVKKVEPIDLLAVDHDVGVKVLTPSAEKPSTTFEEISYSDPFDTSIATNILPGKTELKLLETELIHSNQNNLDDPDFDPRAFDNSSNSKTRIQSVDLLDDSEDIVIHKPLNPLIGETSNSFDIPSEDIDPFDTSIANNIVPDEYTSPHSTASNPFLMDDPYPVEDTQTNNDNPFFSEAPAAASTVSNATNPFAFDPMDLGPSENESNTEVTDLINTQSTNNQPDFFSSTDNSTSNTCNQDLFSNQDLLINSSSLQETAPQKPTELDLKYTNTVANGSAPSRPPPPRPPPSKETQDLLMSVMGAMDATSSTLLDKIPPTRTPSPVNMRDLHSPSPTPEPTFGDLLDVSSGTNKTSQIITDNSSEDLLSLSTQDNSCDINQNQEEAITTKPPRPAPPPARPPRPEPPVKPPPPKNVALPPKPPPPVVAQAQTHQAEDEMMDMFGVESVPQPPKVATKADILNLYNAPAKPEKTATDLLFDSVEPDVKTEEPSGAMIVEPIVEPKVEAPLPPVQEPAVVAQDAFISPEPSQNDLQMDTSDSQSKGSVSSVTFNPFAPADENTQQIIISSPIKVQNDDSNLDNVFNPPESVVDNNIFNQQQQTEIFSAPPAVVDNTPQTQPQIPDFGFGSMPSNNKTQDEFDAFAQKFDSVKDENKNGAFDAFAGANDAWGNDFGINVDSGGGFGNEEPFDAFLALQEPPVVPQSTPNRVSKAPSQESDEDKDFNVFIRPKTNEDLSGGILPTIAPPPAQVQAAFTDTSPRFNPFDQQNDTSSVADVITQQQTVLPFATGPEMKRSDSQETPPTPLFDEDVSQPLEPFPRTNYTGEGWEMQLRQPNKKKITGQRFWKKIFVKIVYQADCVLLQLFNQQSDKDPFQELPLQPCYSVSEIGAQQYDQFGKIFTIKLQYIFYKERPGVRPGQVKKAERITNKLSQFAAYAIQGDYQGVKEFGSDLKKLGLPVEHAPQVSQLMKLGSLNYEDLKQFSFCIEEALFRLQAHRDRALHYKMEEVQITLVDELYVEQDAEGRVEKQIARVRLFFLGFLTGMPDIELGVNDMRRQGKEVVGRHDIIPVVTEEWIRLEDVEFHSCVQQEEWENTHIIKFKPPDACYIELMRFRVRPPKNRELPLQLKATICVTGTRVELRADVLVPGFASRKLGQIPCEDVMIRFPIPECWIYLFRVEKHFRYGSVKSAHRRTGKIKGIERILGAVDTLQESLIEVTSGQAKYEHQHRAIVWRCPRLPKEGQGAYTTHNMVCKLALTSFDQMPEKLAEYCYVEFTMPATQVSHTTCRSVSLQNSDSDEPPEKYVRYLARHEYRVGIEHTEGESPNAYAAATFVKPTPKVEEEKKPAPVPEEDSSSDSD